MGKDDVEDQICHTWQHCEVDGRNHGHTQAGGTGWLALDGETDGARSCTSGWSSFEKYNVPISLQCLTKSILYPQKVSLSSSGQ